MRKGKAPTRHIDPDPRYNDKKTAKFINCLMKQGKKKLARKIFYTALEAVEKKTEKPGIDIFRLAYEKVTPTVESKRKRASGTIRQVPVEVRPKRKIILPIRWLIKGAKKAPGRSMSEKLANELIAASQGEGNAIKEKTTVQKMAESNKAFASHNR